MDYREHTELDDLREQIALLKDKLQRQQIISERAIAEAAQKHIGKLNRAGAVYVFFGVFAVVYCSWAFHWIGFSDEFVIGTAIFLAACAVGTMCAHWGLRSVDVANGNLVEIASRLLKFRRIYSNWHFYTVPTLLVWCYFLYKDAYRMLNNPEGFLLAGIVGGTIGGAIGLWRHFKTLREADKAIANIKDLMEQKE